MIREWWARLDARARAAKRQLVARGRRSAKILAHGAGRGLRRVWSLRKPVARWQRQTRRVQEHWAHYREERRAERAIERVVSGTAPIVVGPWFGEVGYEALYWVPFVRWVKAAFGVKADRLVVVSRGGVDAWYADITAQYVDVFDEISPDEFSALNRARSTGTGTSKQHGLSELDERILRRVRERAGGDVRILHPSLMYQLFREFLAGHRPLAFFDRHTRPIVFRVPPGRFEVPTLPTDYVAVKFYTAQSLPDTPGSRAAVRRLVEAVAERWPVVLLETGFQFDDHADFTLGSGGRIVSVQPFLSPRHNLGVQTHIVAGARAFVGTCGGLAWLAPMVGVDTTAVLTDARYLHTHLQVARRLYPGLGGGTFSPLDLSALEPLGLTLSTEDVAARSRG